MHALQCTDTRVKKTNIDTREQSMLLVFPLLFRGSREEATREREEEQDSLVISFHLLFFFSLILFFIQRKREKMQQTTAIRRNFSLLSLFLMFEKNKKNETERSSPDQKRNLLSSLVETHTAPTYQKSTSFSSLLFGFAPWEKSEREREKCMSIITVSIFITSRTTTRTRIAPPLAVYACMHACMLSSCLVSLLNSLNSTAVLSLSQKTPLTRKQQQHIYLYIYGCV